MLIPRTLKAGTKQYETVLSRGLNVIVDGAEKDEQIFNSVDDGLNNMGTS